MSPSNFPGIGSADESAWFDDEKNNDFLVWKKASREKDEHWLDLKTIIVQVSGMDDVKSFEDFVRQWMQQRNIYEEYGGMKRVPNPKKEELAANITNDLIQELRQKDNRARPAKFQSWLQKGVKHYLPRDIYLIKKRGRVRRIRQSLKVEKTQDSSAEPGTLQPDSYAEPEGSSPSSLPGTPPPGALPTRTRRARKAASQVPSTPAEPIESPMRTLRTSVAQTQIHSPLSEGPHIGSSMAQGLLSSSATDASSLTMVGIRGFEIELEVRVRGQSLLEPPIETTSFAAEMLIKHEYLAELTPLQYRNDHLSFAVFKAAIAQPPTYFNDLEDELGWISADRGFTIINDEWHFQNALGVLRNQGLGRLQLHLRKPAKAFRVIPSRGPLNISWIQSNTRPPAARLAAPVAPMAAPVTSPVISPIASPVTTPTGASNDASTSVPTSGKRLRKPRESEPRGGEKRRRTGRSFQGQAEEKDTEPE